MPFSRPLLTDLRKQVASDIASSVPGSDPLLRISNLRITGDAQAGLAHLHYGYLDWISRQAVPYTSEGEFLEAWGALKGVSRKGATAATGPVTFNGTPGAVIPSGLTAVRGDGTTYTIVADATVSGGGTAVPTVTCSATGAAGNADSGTAMTLGSAVPGVQSIGAASGALTGGADVESDDAFYARVLGAFQSVPQGGAQSDYVTWALQVAGVTRAWAVRNGFGTGTVVLFVMLDAANAAFGGFPQGTDGVASDETRGTSAIGDQLVVADYLYDLQPVTALVYVCSPVADPIDFTINGMTAASTATRNAVKAAISGVLQSAGSPGGTVYLSAIESAIAAVSGTAGFVITSPTSNISSAAGHLPTLGTVTFT